MSYLEQLKEKVRLGSDVFIANNATVIGDVELGDQVSVWYNAVIRGDKDKIIIGDGSNIQDGVIMHTDPGIVLEVGKRVTVGHRAVLHGCKIEDHALIGMGSIILNKVKIGKGCIVGANSLITEGKEFPDFSLIMGSPAKLVKNIPQEVVDHYQKGVDSYIKEASKYLNNIH
ncbi:MAG: gamma carbonic anhydrase family protein [Chitinophagales bacterium]|nr:gamma carbonic anhydrase family protein [Chitinophagales bacterium]